MLGVRQDFVVGQSAISHPQIVCSKYVRKIAACIDQRKANATSHCFFGAKRVVDATSDGSSFRFPHVGLQPNIQAPPLI
ncbi:hypothetical protein BH11PSE11_BH11PSE11_26190 [soil metagenome]